jgi:hypothetical protein
MPYSSDLTDAEWNIFEPLTLFYVSSSLVHRLSREVFDQSDAVTNS